MASRKSANVPFLVLGSPLVICIQGQNRNNLFENQSFLGQHYFLKTLKYLVLLSIDSFVLLYQKLAENVKIYDKSAMKKFLTR